MTIKIEVDVSSVVRNLDRMAGEFRDRRTPNRQLGIELYGWTLRNFNGGGSLQPQPWAPLKASTAKQKARLGYSQTPLIRTGHYRQSFRPFSDNDQAGVGSEVPYSKYHEDGTATLPARKALPPREVVLDYAVKIYDRWVAKIIDAKIIEK